MANFEINIGINVSRNEALKAAKILEMYFIENEDLKLDFERVDGLPVVSIAKRAMEAKADGFGGVIIKYLE